MGCGSSCCAEEPAYSNGRPLIEGGKVTPCFDKGTLFKVVKGSKWYYYNDTQDMMMHVKTEFGAGSCVVASDDAKVVKTSEDGSCTLTLDIPPLETLQLAKVKEMNGFSTNMQSVPVSQQEVQRQKLIAREKAAKELQVMQGLAKSKSISCDHKLLRQARKSSKMFVDVSFPPTNTSLVRTGVDKQPEGTLRNLDSFCWRRPEDFLPVSWRDRIELYDGVAATDIDQGALGDCYFLCSCAALAEFPKQIMGLFENDCFCCTERAEHAHGAWRVNLCVNGWWRTFIIDSYLPSTTLLPCFARNRHHPNELWVSFVEKAYAKAYGSYQAIVGGFPWQALEDLTGCPAYCFDDAWEKAAKSTTEQDKLFAMLNKWSDQDYLISVSTPSAATKRGPVGAMSSAQVEELFKKAGLATGHAYTVLSVKHFPLHRLCMLKIRNPWGEGAEWTGDWSDNSDLWSQYPIIKLACKPDKKKDGIFWMEWKDVVKFFDSGAVCFRQGQWYSTWHNYRVPGQFDKLIPSIALEIIVEDDTFDAYFTLQQKDKRGLGSGDPDSTYAAIMLSLSKGEISGGQQKVVTNSNDNPEEPSEKYLFQLSRSVSLFHTFEKGFKYFIIPRRMQSATGNNNPTKKFVLSMMTSKKVSGSGVKVNFVRIAANNPAFQNITSFDIGTLTSVSTTFQERHANDLFMTKNGVSFNKGSKLHSAEYECVI